MPTRDEPYLNCVRELPCIGCGKHGPSEAHHILTRGAGGGDDYWNLLSLCAGCHTGNTGAWHRGKIRFLEEHPHVLEYMYLLGWELNGTKLFHPRMLDNSGESPTL